MNRELALQNTDREPQFTQAKEELRCLVTEAEELKADYDQGYNELSESVCSVCCVLCACVLCAVCMCACVL